MEAAAEPQKIILTEAEYQALLAGSAKQTVTVDAAEYASLIAGKADVAKIQQERDRYAGRCRELETCLRREQAEHKEELDAALAMIRKLKGGAM